MEHADYTRGASFTNDCPRVVFSLARMHHHRTMDLSRQRHLRREGCALCFARRVVVMVVEPAFADGDRTRPEMLAKPGNVAPGIEALRVVRMDSSGREYEFGLLDGALRGDRRRLERLADANDGPRTRIPGARDYRVAVAGERRVCEVGVAVDEDWRAPVLRGHLRSIQSRTGAAM